MSYQHKKPHVLKPDMLGLKRPSRLAPGSDSHPTTATNSCTLSHHHPRTITFTPPPSHYHLHTTPFTPSPSHHHPHTITFTPPPSHHHLHTTTLTPTGRNYDGDGNLAVWWSQASIDAFEERAQCFVDQYNSYHPPEVTDPSVHVRDLRFRFSSLA